MYSCTLKVSLYTDHLVHPRDGGSAALNLKPCPLPPPPHTHKRCSTTQPWGGGQWGVLRPPPSPCLHHPTIVTQCSKAYNLPCSIPQATLDGRERGAGCQCWGSVRQGGQHQPGLVRGGKGGQRGRGVRGGGGQGGKGGGAGPQWVWVGLAPF